MKAAVLLGLSVALLCSVAYADNENASLAMHLVASSEYLECPQLCPPEMSCLDLDCDLSLEEVQASDGYGYLAFVAYNVDEIMGIEFSVVGWPIGPGTPAFDGPYYCPLGAQLFGEPFEKRGGRGGYLAIDYLYPCTRMVCLCIISFGADVYDWLPIVLEYAPSTFSYPSGLNYYNPCVQMEDIVFTHEHYAVIGGECEPIPNCEPGPTGSEGVTWGRVKSLYR